MTWVGLCCVTVLFPDHTHLLFVGILNLNVIVLKAQYQASNFINFIYTYVTNKNFPDNYRFLTNTDYDDAKINETVIIRDLI